MKCRQALAFRPFQDSMELTKVKLALACQYSLHRQPPRNSGSKTFALAKILKKLTDEEKLDLEDWNEVVQLGLLAFTWLADNSRVEVTPASNQIHLQPKKSLKKKK